MAAVEEVPPSPLFFFPAPPPEPSFFFFAPSPSPLEPSAAFFSFSAAFLYDSLR